MEFKKAVRKAVKLKLAITGPTGSGKTYSALVMAKGMGGKIAVIDTENGSASLYSDKFEFDVLEISPPFTTEKYIAAINSAEKAGYEIIIIDSLTHAWAGEGGLLEQKAALDARPGSNHWSNWKPIDLKDAALKNAFLHSPVHIIATMRSKMEYAQGEENGKKKIEKLGMAPIQRDGLSYEFTTVFDIAMNNEAGVSKDRTGIFAGTFFKITEDTGKKFMTWMNSGASIVNEPKKPEPIVTKPVEKVSESPTFESESYANFVQPSHQSFIQEEEPQPSVTAPVYQTIAAIGDEGMKKLKAKLLSVGRMNDWKPEEVGEKMREKYGVKGMADLRIDQYDEFYQYVSKNKSGLIGGVIHERS